MSTIKKQYSYEGAGVDIEKADALVDSIKSIAKKTHRPGVLGGIGGFGGLFELPSGYKNPVLVSGTDGVGTKLKLAIDMHRHDTIGIDLVAMCVNDILTTGATPLFFLDYYATGALNPEQAKTVLGGIASGCQLADVALIGGETAEMPGLYHGTDYDLAGFCVGIIEKDKIIDAHRVAVGDQLIAIASSGVHSNGYSLVRQLITEQGFSLSHPFATSTLGDVLLTPTRIYTAACQRLFSLASVHGLSHITGGGLKENIPRMLQSYTKAVIETRSWVWPPIFSWLQENGNISLEEMRRTFNLGIGLVICVSAKAVDQVLESLAEGGECAWRVGYIAHSNDPHPVVDFVESVCPS